jgi:hypothetical protein
VSPFPHGQGLQVMRGKIPLPDLRIENRIAGKDQALYFGFAKPREAHHDADLYRLYQKAADKIRRNLRVVLSQTFC